MPVFSYIAYPVCGKKSSLLNSLSLISYCSAVAADNREVIILVTDTPDEPTEKRLQEQLKSLPSLQSLNMTFGHGDE